MQWVFAAAQTAHMVSSFTLLQAPYPSSPYKLPASRRELRTNVEPFQQGEMGATGALCSCRQLMCTKSC